MSERDVFRLLLGAWFVLSAIVFVVLRFIAAPYGRHARPGWGPTLPARLGWMLMEAPSPLLILGCLLRFGGTPGAWALGSLWLVHYANRAALQPLRAPAGARPIPVLVCAMAVGFNLVNGWLNGRSLTGLGPAYAPAWWTTPTVWLGLLLWAAGWGVNLHADAVLRRLRLQGGGYRVPEGGLYRFVSCPNYFGEILEWVGFAVAAGSPAAWSFAVWTFANLAPRAVTHHRWYVATFPGYPAGRRALVPWLW